MWCFWEFVFPSKNAKQACFGSAVTFDSRRLHSFKLLLLNDLQIRILRDRYKSGTSLLRFWLGFHLRPRPKTPAIGEGNSEEYHRDMLPILARQRQAILDLAARHGLRNVRVFGSVLRGEDGPNSDIDLLVAVEPGRTLLDVIGFEQDVEELLARPVDVVSEGGLSPYLQGRILAEAAAL